MSSNTDIAFFKTFAPAVFANGYTPLPIRPRTKMTRLPRWQFLCGRSLRPSKLQGFVAKYPCDSVGLACGAIIAIDIDSLDETRAGILQGVAEEILGPTPLLRIGRYPKRMLIYRSADPSPRTQRLGDIEILGNKAYVLAFGIHPQTGRPYEWTGGASPVDLRRDQVPAVGNDQIQALIRQIQPDLAQDARRIARTHTTAAMPAKTIVPVEGSPWVKDRRGLIVDGRDPYLAHLVWTQAQSTLPDAKAIADAAWQMFATSADLTRNRRNGHRRWTRADAFAKAQALLRSGKITRPWTSLSIDEAKSFWTPQTKNAFAVMVARAGAMRFLSPAAVKVSNQMLAVVHGSGACFLSTQTLARDTDLSIDTVKKSRRQLRQRGFWTAHLSQGGRGEIACYRPEPAVLDRNFDEARDPFDLETVDVKGTQIPSEEEVDWEDILLFKNKNQIEREAAVGPRRSGAASIDPARIDSGRHSSADNEPRVPASTCAPLNDHAAVPASPSRPVMEVTLARSSATAVSRPVLDITLHHGDAAGQLKPSPSPIEKSDGE